MSPKSVPEFDKKYKKVQIKTKKLKKIQKREETEKKWENFRLIQLKKEQVIAKAKKAAYCKSKKEVCTSLKIYGKL